MRLGRRAFLNSTLATAVLSRPLAAVQAAPRRVKGVIWLWMGGGMSQIDTFDPKPGTKGGGPFKAIDTAVPGIQVSEHLPVCASQMKHLSILRTVAHRAGDPDRAIHLLHTGVAPGEDVPTIGTIVSRELAKRDFPLPSHLVIEPPLHLPQSAVLGEDHLPFQVNNPDNPIPNIRRNVAADRDRQRASLLLEQNREWGALRRQEEVKRLESGIAKSEEVMNTPLLRAFNWAEEPKELQKEYGGRFGLNCLLARRLVQTGCAFVEIGLGGWNIRSDSFSILKMRIPELDKGLGTLVKDLAEKDLLKDVVVVCATEFGRTPDVNGGLGRDRWANGFSVVLAGGSLAGGRVHGSTGAEGRKCEPPLYVPDFLATVYRACGIDPDQEYELEEGQKVRYAQGGKPVVELF